MVQSKKATSAEHESAVSETHKKIDIEETLRVLLSEKEKRDKDEKIKKYVWIAILVVCVYNAVIFFSMYSYFKSPEFLESLKYRAIEVMPTIGQELGKTAEKSAPILFEELKKQFENYLPVMQQKVLDRYKELNEQAVEISKKEFETAVNAQLESDFNKLSNSTGAQLTPEQFADLKATMMEHVDKTVGDIVTKSVGSQLNMCVEGVSVMREVGENLAQKTDDMKGKIDSKSEIERKKIGFDIFRSFLDAIDHKQTGRLPEGMTAPAAEVPAK